MIEAIIRASIANRALVLIGAALIAVFGWINLRSMPVDAIPDLSDVQVIVKTTFPGQAPQVVEQQVTYPLTTALMAVPGAETVRGFSFFGDSFVYIIFADGTDPYWARSRVLEYLSQIAPKLPEGANPALGPDATGVGWVYEYALVDRTGNHDLSQLRAIQDWFLKFELQAVPGVSEVASVGGMVKQYQVVVDPNKLRSFGISLPQVSAAIRNGNSEAGGSVIEMGESEFMVRATGYIEGIEQLQQIPLRVNGNGTPVFLSQIAEIKTGPQLRRGVAELNGEGEVAGGIIVMRFGENAQAVISAVKDRLEGLRKSLPEGVEIVPTYDRSQLIGRAVDNLYTKLLEEFIVVALICGLFLFHLRSALVAIIVLPLGILIAMMILRAQGLNANIMSLGGIAIAIGAMVDAAIVMIENVHKHIEHDDGTTPRWKLVADASAEVGPALFFSLMIITLSFLPVFTLEAQEGRLFAPLAYTKTWAMAAGAALSITLVPVLMGFLIRGDIVPEHKNPINRALSSIYRPVIDAALRAPYGFIAGAVVIALISLYPASKLGSEFMPALDEGDWMYMPTTRPGLSIGEASELLQKTDKLIKSVPEVAQVFGKIGRAETATDPAPLTMIETVIRFKPESEWRAGMTIEKIRAEIKTRVNLPGVTNAWVMPIKTRIDMLATGIKTPVGIKVSGPDLKTIQFIGLEIEELLPTVRGTTSVYAERVVGGRYIVADIDRLAAARYGLNIADVQSVIMSAVGGIDVSEAIEGLQRFPINVRYPREVRESLESIRKLPMVTSSGQHIQLSDVASVQVEDGPPMIKSENARPTGYVFVDIADRDIGSYVTEAKQYLLENLSLPSGYSISWSGQYEYMERAKARLQLVVPVTLMIIFLLLYLTFRNVAEPLMILATLPFALAGGIALTWGLGHSLSVASGIGFIALAGVAAEFGVIMLIYLDAAVAKYRKSSAEITLDGLKEAIQSGAVQRVRPKAMTVTVIIAGLLPLFFGQGTGSEVMRRIAAPMVGGMISAPLVSMVIIPAVYLLWASRKYLNCSADSDENAN
ncbi:MAG: Cu(I)/Ag(I) efflux system membrane protein CusA/SilA [Gammaproteobacteria bacterium]|jgi:Cu(I)/Ag(I) efflux system membrane protein CusA/SilA